MCRLRCHGRRRLSAAVVLLFFATALGGELVTGAGAAEEGYVDVEARGMQGRRLQREQYYYYYYWGRPTVPARRRVVGPGSSPPTCRGRCGRCAPCRPVRVVVQPGRSAPLEYYPEAWRCLCGNKLFMP